MILLYIKFWQQGSFSSLRSVVFRLIRLTFHAGGSWTVDNSIKWWFTCCGEHSSLSSHYIKSSPQTARILCVCMHASARTHTHTRAKIRGGDLYPVAISISLFITIVKAVSNMQGWWTSPIWENGIVLSKKSVYVWNRTMQFIFYLLSDKGP